MISMRISGRCCCRYWELIDGAMVWYTLPCSACQDYVLKMQRADRDAFRL